MNIKAKIKKQPKKQCLLKTTPFVIDTTRYRQDISVLILCVKNYSSLFAAENTNCCLTLVINDCSIAFDVYDVSYNQYPVYCRKIGEGLDLSNSTFWFSHSNIQKKNQTSLLKTNKYIWWQSMNSNIYRMWHCPLLIFSPPSTYHLLEL